MKIAVRCLAVAFAIGAVAQAAAGASASVNRVIEEQVPFVGCAADGQVGPISAPGGFAKLGIRHPLC